jgi:hypothetical protein
MDWMPSAVKLLGCVIFVACSSRRGPAVDMHWRAGSSPSSSQAMLGDSSMFHIERFADAGAGVDPPVACGNSTFLIVVHGGGHRHFARNVAFSCRSPDAGACRDVDGDAFFFDLRTRHPSALAVGVQCTNRPHVIGPAISWPEVDTTVETVVRALEDWDLAEDVGVFVTPPPPPAILL